MTASLVAPEPSYRVVQTGQIVPASATQTCPYCPRRGSCNACLGSRRILLDDGLHWTVPVVEDSNRHGEQSDAHAAAGTPEFVSVPMPEVCIQVVS